MIVDKTGKGEGKELPPKVWGCLFLTSYTSYLFIIHYSFSFIFLDLWTFQWKAGSWISMAVFGIFSSSSFYLLTMKNSFSFKVETRLPWFYRRWFPAHISQLSLSPGCQLGSSNGKDPGAGGREVILSFCFRWQLTAMILSPVWFSCPPTVPPWLLASGALPFPVFLQTKLAAAPCWY